MSIAQNKLIPWANHCCLSVIDGEVNRSIDYIDDSTISQGTIVPCSVLDGTFSAIGMADYNMGELNTDQLTSSIEKCSREWAAPSGFSYGNFEVM